jgi:DNA-directed RNA polymerase specialized sigma24 family protein
MASVTNEAVALYYPTIERLAERFNKRDYHIETDDLIQEAWEKTWLALERGITPTKTLMLNAMNDWASHVTHGVPIEPAGLNVQEAVSR